MLFTLINFILYEQSGLLFECVFSEMYKKRANFATEFFYFFPTSSRITHRVDPF